MPVERVGNDAPGVVDRKAQRPLLRSATGRRAEYAGADADADDRQTAIEIVPGQPQFRAEARDQIAADDAFWTGTEQDKTIMIFCVDGNRGARRKRPTIAETDIAALEMVFEQAKILRFHMLEDGKSLHTSIRSSAGRQSQDTSAAKTLAPPQDTSAAPRH